MTSKAIIEIKDGDLSRRDNEIPRGRISIKSTGPGTASLAIGARIVLNWPIGVSFLTENDGVEMTDYDIEMDEVCRIPRNVSVEVGLRELNNDQLMTGKIVDLSTETLESLFAVALAKDSSLTIYVDFTEGEEGKVTFELKSSLGEVYGLHTIEGHFSPLGGPIIFATRD